MPTRSARGRRELACLNLDLPSNRTAAPQEGDLKGKAAPGERLQQRAAAG